VIVLPSFLLVWVGSSKESPASRFGGARSCAVCGLMNLTPVTVVPVEVICA